MKLPQSLNVPCSNAINAQIRIPGSKSITNRAILIASLAKGESCLEGVLHSDDTQHMMHVCRHLGTRFNETADGLKVVGCDGQLAPSKEEFYIENAGTAARFLTAALTLGQGKYVLTGNERMQQRPIKDLLDAIKSLGGKVRDIEGTGCPPVEIVAEGLPGGVVDIPGDKSSQYISAIILAAPYAQNETIINIIGPLVSRSYVEMTMDIMGDFGVNCEWVDKQTLSVKQNQNYIAKNYSIEGDASSASYFFGMAAVTQGTIKVSGLQPDSTQGDLGLLGILEKMGCEIKWLDDGVIVKGNPLKGVDVDMNTMSDVAPTLAVIALFAEGKTRINNVANMRIKECDRIRALITELKKIGADVEEWDDGLSITGLKKYNPAELHTYKDHRMAMSFSLAGLKIPGITIQDPACVSKTFPGFFDMFLPVIQQ